MTDTERAAWTAFEQGIVEDAIAAGMIDSATDVVRLNRWYTEREMEAVHRYATRAIAATMQRTITANGDGTWDHTFTVEEH